MRKTKIAAGVWLASNIIGGIILFLMPGRKIANAHPFIRGGGDYGFGGLDFYEKAGDDISVDIEYHI